MKIVDYVNDRGNRCKEDRIGFGKDYAYVMDGATGLTTGLIEGYLSDTVWFVETATSYLDDVLTKDVTIESQKLFKGLSDHLNKTLNQLINIEDYGDEQLPSAAIILARKINNDLVIESFGDCTGVVEHNDGHFDVIHDGRATDLDEGIIKRMKAIVKNEGVTMEEAKKAVHPFLLENRQLKNQPDGYAVVDITHNYIGKGLSKVYPYNDVRSLSLFSDGVDSYYSDLHLATDAIDMVKQLKQTSAHQIVDRLRITEESDVLLQTYPRMKPKDDASLIYLTIDS